MKYSKTEIVPFDEQVDVNKILLTLIRTDSTKENNITQNDVYNSYSAMGQHHGCTMYNGESFANYIQRKNDIGLGRYYTPDMIVESMYDIMTPTTNDTICDSCVGSGNFINFAPNESNFYGSDIDQDAIDICKFLYPKAHIESENMCYYKPSNAIDYVMGNPPFGLRLDISNVTYDSEMVYLMKAFEYLKVGGFVCCIVPTSFLSDLFAEKSKINTINDMFNFIGQIGLNSRAFNSEGVISYTTKIMVFQKRSEHIEHTPYNNNFVDDFELTNLVNVAKDFKRLLQYKLDTETLSKVGDNNEYCFSAPDKNKSDGYSFKLKKYLFEVKQNPNTVKHYNKCLAKVKEFNEQKCPEHIIESEWQKTKLTKPKVLAYVKGFLKRANKKHSVDEIRLVRNQYAFYYKGYSVKANKYLKENSLKDVVFNIYSIVDVNDIPKLQSSEDINVIQFSDNFINTPINRYKKQHPKTAIKNITPSAEQISFCDNLILPNGINPYPIQKDDISKLMNRNGYILNWEMGSGKTIAATAIDIRLKQLQKITTTFIVCNAIGINNMWVEWLDENNYSYIKPRKLSQLENIKDGVFVLLTNSMCNKLKYGLKNYMKKHKHNINFILDECDIINNVNTISAKAVIDVFRKSKYKTIMSGTVTRNNANDIFNVVCELLYNGSLVCDCEKIYTRNELGTLLPTKNKWYGKTFPRYKLGYGVFSKCYSPSKQTVLGIDKNTVDVVNKDSYVNILNTNILTRSYAEVTNNIKPNNHQIIVKMSDEENVLYRKIYEDFGSLERNYFASTGSSRKDAYMKIIRQINLMLRSCTNAKRFDEYVGATPTKFIEALKLINSKTNEKFIIGLTEVDNVSDLYKYLSENTDRPIKMITGAISHKKRKEILSEIELTANGIVVATMQSLPSAINAPTIQNVIVMQLNMWNMASINQFIFRVVRATSTTKKDVYFILTQNTIEMNLANLVFITKEKVNMLVKGYEVESDDLCEQYGFEDTSFLNNVMRKVKDVDGHTSLELWSDQNII